MVPGRCPSRCYPSIFAGAVVSFAGDFFTDAFFTGAFFFAAFLTAAFAEAGCAFAAAFFAAQRFFKAATIAALPALLSFRFGFAGSGVDAGAGGSDSPRIFAHLALCAMAIFRREAAENLRFLVGASGVAAVPVEPPGSIARSSAIWASNFFFWASIPRIAAVKISVVSFGVGMSLDLPRFVRRYD